MKFLLINKQNTSCYHNELKQMTLHRSSNQVCNPIWADFDKTPINPIKNNKFTL